MVPANVPARVPVPVFNVRLTPVDALTLVVLPLESCDWTITENAVAAVGLVPPLTEVIASVVTGPAFTVIAGLVFAVAAGPDTLVAVTVRVPAVFSVTVNPCVPATRP